MKFNLYMWFLPLFSLPAAAGGFEYDFSGSVRTVPGYVLRDDLPQKRQTDFHLPFHGKTENVVSYTFDDSASVSLFITLYGQSGTNLENLNQGNWGEEITGLWASEYGELYIGQAENVAVMFGVNKPDMNIWQIQPVDMVNYLSNPNWRQKKNQKYYNTLDSTLINTDGSSFKLTYLFPEWHDTQVGISYTPENNAKDGLSSKHAPYYDKNSWTVSLHNYRYFDFGETNFYAAFADFADSHQEYATGISFYRKGWTLFASYRKTKTGHADAPVAEQTYAPLYFDTYRRGYAWNTGIGLQFSYLSAIVSYFESCADISAARNRFANLHLSFKKHKSISFYGGLGWSEFKTGKDSLAENNHGLYTYGGVEFNF